MQYKTLSLIDGVRTVRSLIAENFRETGLSGHPFNLHDSTYRWLSENDGGFVIVAFDDDKNVVGYVSVFLTVHQHTSEMIAQNDAIYVCPDFRNSFLGGSLMLRAERESRNRGCVSFFWGVVEGTPIDKALESRTAYRPFQRTYLKEL